MTRYNAARARRLEHEAFQPDGSKTPRVFDLEQPLYLCGVCSQPIEKGQRYVLGTLQPSTRTHVIEGVAHEACLKSGG